MGNQAFLDGYLAGYMEKTAGVGTELGKVYNNWAPNVVKNTVSGIGEQARLAGQGLGYMKDVAGRAGEPIGNMVGKANEASLGWLNKIDKGAHGPNSDIISKGMDAVGDFGARHQGVASNYPAYKSQPISPFAPVEQKATPPPRQYYVPGPVRPPAIKRGTDISVDGGSAMDYLKTRPSLYSNGIPGGYLGQSTGGNLVEVGRPTAGSWVNESQAR